MRDKAEGGGGARGMVREGRSRDPGGLKRAEQRGRAEHREKWRGGGGNQSKWKKKVRFQLLTSKCSSITN